MVDGIKNNGNALSCVVLFIDSLAYENGSQAFIETRHTKDCGIHEYIADEDNPASYDEDLGADNHASCESLKHLYSCTCNPSIDAVFEKNDGEKLFVPFRLSTIKEAHPWLEDDEQTVPSLAVARELGPESPLVKKMRPFFMKQMGHNLNQLEIQSKFSGGVNNTRPH
jgi:hypothetical protein|tara:strand:+ start:907 stop:1410 length:504 start_codon:yes stop_codon:yes gene_type:complete